MLGGVAVNEFILHKPDKVVIVTEARPTRETVPSVAFNVYEEGAVIGPVETELESAVLDTPGPETETLVQFEVLQMRVEDAPELTLVGLAAKELITQGSRVVVVTVTVTA